MVEEVPALSTFTLQGRLDMLSVAEVEKRPLEVVASTERHLTIQAEGLEFISSAGIRALLTALKRMRAKGGSVGISGMRPGVREVLGLTGILTLLSPSVE